MLKGIGALIKAVPWGGSKTKIGLATTVGAIITVASVFAMRTIVPVEAQTALSSPLPAPNVEQAGTNNNNSNHQSGGQTGNNSYNLGPCSGATGNSRPDCSHHTRYEIHEDEDAGYLVPAHDKLPSDDSCSKSLDGMPGMAMAARLFTVYFGNGTFIPQAFPFTIFQFGNKSLFSVDQLPNGKIGINVEIDDQNGLVVAAISDNKWHVNRNNIFYKENPDKSTLIVYDQHNNRVLVVRYNSPKFMTIRGELHYANDSIGLLDDGTLLFPGHNTFGNLCAAGSRIAVQIGGP